ncbi:MAG: amidophosphoribosyltransferase, partial [Candidatus Electrothrix sp. AW1]|nr:amidophosphoribosyltransferase [Candidatus Electrothrix gigas]
MKHVFPSHEPQSRPTHECGICGIYGHEDAAKLTYFGLYALQHRGQESAGIVSGTGEEMHIHKDMGLVPEVFTESNLQRLSGHLAVGHVRYSTTGESSIVNTQPFMVTHQGTPIAVAHNGNLVNSVDLRNQLEQKGSIFQTTMDSEIAIQLMARTMDMGMIKAIKETFACICGAS